MEGTELITDILEELREKRPCLAQTMKPLKSSKS